MTQWTRWVRFNMVGVAGFAVQMATLAALEKWFPAPVGVAVTLAVLVAVSHNFLWHERVTWPGRSAEGRWRRWLAFNASTGVVSVVTNLVVTTIVSSTTGAALLLSNLVAVLSASLVNFWVSDRAVFSHSRQLRHGRKRQRVLRLASAVPAIQLAARCDARRVSAD